MTVKEELERQEHRNLNPLAAFADESRGRPRPDPEREQDVRTCYQRDTDRIVHSKSFRRLMHKTQPNSKIKCCQPPSVITGLSDIFVLI